MEIINKTLIFYNHFGYGDIHVSRSFVLDMINKIKPKETIYYHRFSDRLLLDLPLRHIQKNPEYPREDLINITDNEIIVNTWYNSSQKSFKKNAHKGGCLLDTLYGNFEEVYSVLGIELFEIKEYVPSINFNAFDIDSIINFFRDEKRKTVFVCNSKPISGQSPFIDFNSILDELSDNFNDYLFIVSNDIKIEKNNIIFSKDIIKTSSVNDLCENSYLSTFCDYIVGNNSGAHTFSIVKENVMGEKMQKNVQISFLTRFIEQHYNHKTKEFIDIYNTEDLVNKLINILNN